MDDNKLAEISINEKRVHNRAIRFIWRIVRKNILFGKIDNFCLIRTNKGKVKFIEEDGDSVVLLKFNEFARSATLFDQREILVRSIVSTLIRSGIINKDGNIIDCGACCGDTSLIWAKMINGTVYAIDPGKGNIKFIEKVSAINNIKNIRAICCALSDSAGTLYPASDVNHSAFTSKPLHKYGERNAVDSTTLDDMFAAGIIRDVELLHLDVEGMELRVLSSGQAFIKASSPVIIFEAHLSLDDIDSICSILRHLRYEVYLINESTPGGRPDCVNFIAFPDKINRAEILDSLNKIVPRQNYYKTTYGPNLIEI